MSQTSYRTTLGVNVFIFQDTQKEEYAESLKKTLKMLSDFLGDKPWFVGDQVCIDFYLSFTC